MQIDLCSICTSIKELLGSDLTLRVSEVYVCLPTTLCLLLLKSVNYRAAGVLEPNTVHILLFATSFLCL